MTYKWSAGRYVRTILGVILTVGNLVLIGLQIAALAGACKAAAATCTIKIPWENIALHGMLLLGGWALIHKESLIEVLQDLPVIGTMVNRMRRPPTP